MIELLESLVHVTRGIVIGSCILIATALICIALAWVIAGVAP